MTFRPLVRDDATAADWAGISLDNYFKHTLDNVDIGHAIVPVFAFYPDSQTTIREAHIHHFRDVGVWVDGSKGTGIVITSSSSTDPTTVIERGSGIDEALGNEGIFLDEVGDATITNTRVTLAGIMTAVGDFGGIRVHHGKPYCVTAAVPPEVITIQGNVIEGNGFGELSGRRSGIWLDWVCGKLDRDVNVTQNAIAHWNYAGVWLAQSADVQISCNRIEDSRRGVALHRDGEPTGSGLRFKDNHLELPSGILDTGAFESDNAGYTKLGGTAGQVDRGGNRLSVPSGFPQPPIGLYEDDTAASHAALDARRNYWIRAGNVLDNGPGEEIPDMIDAHFGTADVDYGNFLVQDPPPVLSCLPPGAAAAPLPPRDRRDRTGDEEVVLGVDRLGAVAPETSTLRDARPNPSRGAIFLDVGVGRHGGRHSLQVYDVRGRRVRTLLDSEMSAAWYRVAWDERDESGARVAAGVYFARLSGPGGAFVRKLVIVE